MGGPIRYNRDHRDANEPEIVDALRRLGGDWVPGPPLDGWAWLPRIGWLPVEVKDPSREGHADEYEKSQLEFFEWCRVRRAKWLVWRLADDVVRDMGGRVAA